MKTGNYIIASKDKNTGRCSMAVNPKEHASEHVAKNEAARLAASDTHKEFTVLRVVGTASVQQVAWR